MNNLISIWDGNKIHRRPGTAISSSFVITEFPRTYVNKILSYNLGKIDFNSVVDLNQTRNEVIDNFKTQELPSGDFKYKVISNVFTDEIQISSDENNNYPVLTHGVPVSRSTKENCSINGFYCLDGNGSNKICNSGKCVIGYLKRKSNFSWEYSSVNLYGVDNSPFSYSICGSKVINLHNILRGVYEGVSITSPASRYTEIYLPPINYLTKISFDKEFRVDSKVVTHEEINIFVGDKYKTAKSNLIGVNDPKTLFIGQMITGTYEGLADGSINSKLKNPVENELVQYVISQLDELPSTWLEESKRIIEYCLSVSTNTFDFLFSLYDELYSAYQNIILVGKSSIRRSKITTREDNISRPIYNRLPGISESYYKDPSSEEDPIAKWIISGSDEFLSRTKELIASFYYNYLDPNTCNPLHLDWLAQHIGLFGDLWDTTWENKIKVAMIQNAYGWWDRTSSISISGGENVPTSKGDALSKFPFTSDIWTSIEEEDNSRSISLMEIETLKVSESNTKTITEFFKFKEKTYSEETGLFSLTPTNSIKFYKERWNGLFESKGTYLCVAFLSSIFGLKSHVPDELRILNADVKTRQLPNGEVEKYLGNKIITPRTGLRASESSAPPLLPYKQEMAICGDENDAVIGNYTNQLVAGVTRAASYNISKHLFFRVPYYYNRNGRSWKKVEYIIKNWIPANINSRVQYPYLSADLWSVGDAFFEPEIEIE